MILHYWEMEPKTIYNMISQKVVDGLWQNLVEELDWWQDYILLQIQPIKWDTKRKLVNLAEVCAPPSAILLCSVLPNVALWVIFHLFVSMSRISQKVSQSRTKFGGQVGCATRMKLLDFGDDLDPDSRILKWFFTIERLSQNQYIAWYFKKLWTDYDKTRWMSWVDDKNQLGRCFG